jgi:tetratricopeptide (TPR) repeat protein
MEEVRGDVRNRPNHLASLALMHQSLGVALANTHTINRSAEAEKSFNLALPIWKKLTADYPLSPSYRRWLGRCYYYQAHLLRKAGKMEDASIAYQSALRHSLRLFTDYPAHWFGAHYATMVRADLTVLFGTLKAAGKPNRTEAFVREMVREFEKIKGEVIAGESSGIAACRFYGVYAEFLQLAGQMQEAEKAYRQAIQSNREMVAAHPASLYRWAELGWEHWRFASFLDKQLNRSDAAESEFRNALEISEKLRTDLRLDHEDQIHLGERARTLAKHLASAGKFADAASFFERGLKHYQDLQRAYPGTPEYTQLVADAHGEFAVWLGHSNRASILEQLGKWPEAIVEYRKAIQSSPKDVGLYMKLGKALTQQDMWDDAILEYKKALGLDSTCAQAQYEIGNTLEKKGDIEGALAAFRKTISMDAKHSNAHNNLAWLLATCPDLKLRDPKQAVESAKESIELWKEDGNHWNTLGVAHYRARNWNAAIEALNKSDELLKGDFFSFNAFFLAMAHWQLGNKVEAQKWHEKAVQWVQKNEEALKKDKKNYDELRRFRAEAEELLGIAEKRKQPQMNADEHR